MRKLLLLLILFSTLSAKLMEASTPSYPQHVTESPGENAIFLVYPLSETPAAHTAVKDLCADWSGLVRSIRNRYPELSPNAVIGFGAEAWPRLFPEQPTPRELKVFNPIVGSRYTAPSTPGDLFFHIRAGRMSACYELAAIVEERLRGTVTPVDEVHGFRYFDGRAILGFVDGTENPDVDDNRYRHAVIPASAEPHFAGGSYAFVQKYIHDMAAWNALSTEEQELVIGRRKFNDRELTDDVKPLTAHNAVTNIQDEEGEDLKIVRANMPFANTSKGEYGTYFIGYASTFTTTRRMLENMFLGDARADGQTDRLLDFSTAVTGTLFFVPSYDLLSELGE